VGGVKNRKLSVGEKKKTRYDGKHHMTDCVARGLGGGKGNEGSGGNFRCGIMEGESIKEKITPGGETTGGGELWSEERSASG